MRLHISPFTPDLLRAIVPASANDLVENMSYHELQTFPEHNYGYLDLPAMEAEKLKTRLNGAILKGKKIKVEEARPRERRHVEEGTEEFEVKSTEPTVQSSARKSKRSRVPDILPGRSISPDRIVKRGWTEVKDERSQHPRKDKSKRISSKYTDKEELLFQTKVPVNRKDLVKEDRKRNGKKKNSDGDVIHEFERNVPQPSFLRHASSSNGKNTKECAEGKGWLDDQGNIVEDEPRTSKRVSTMKSTRRTRSSKTKETSSEESDSKSSGDNTPRPVSTFARSGRTSTPLLDESDETSSSGSSSSEAESGSEDSNAVSSQASSGEEKCTSSPNPNASVHPLEALFKKPSKPASQDVAKPSLEVQTSFSFFNKDEDDLEEESVVPGTPFSTRDTHSRGHRSAAPTPDTAHPSRFNSYSSLLGDSDEEDEHPKTKSHTSLVTSSKSLIPNVSQEQSAFEKQFWEKRGELGRGWKRRRREVQKEKRHIESRAKKRNW